MLGFITLLSAASLLTVSSAAWTTPSMMYQCRSNADCRTDQCCVLSPIVKKRGLLLDPFYAHTCDSLLNETSSVCYMGSQYSSAAHHYTMLCPCKPGLRCQAPNPPVAGFRGMYGKCVQA